MHIICIGLNHTTAPIEVRECLAFAPSSLLAAVARFGCGHCEGRPAGTTEGVLLSTCNRLEVYVLGSPGERARSGILPFPGAVHHRPRQPRQLGDMYPVALVDPSGDDPVQEDDLAPVLGDAHIDVPHPRPERRQLHHLAVVGGEKRLRAAAAIQLERAGVARIEVSARCTWDDPELWSYRRAATHGGDPRTGRQGALVAPRA